MLVTLLGTSDAAGIPVHSCDCATCQEALQAPWLHRSQTCILIQSDEASILVDMGSDSHMRNLHTVNLDAVFVTHCHDDHVRGLFALRWTKRLGGLPVYYPRGSEAIELFDDPMQLRLHTLKDFEEVTIKDLTITTLPLAHSVEAYGYLIGDDQTSLAVLLDTGRLPETTFYWLITHRPTLVMIDSTYAPGLSSEHHLGVDEALETIDDLGVRRAVLTHIAHHNWPYRDLVRYVYEQDGARTVVAYDGLTLTI
ncbi:MAG: MBL fold metallo-hydrolase [Anaerolineae bacterium]|nr:MBL fold metallo-hydrolase [Anaerolineae bacterium]